MIISQMEDAFVAQLADAFGSRVKEVDHKPDRLTAEELARILTMAPGAYVAFLGMSRADRPEGTWRAQFGIYLLAGNAAGERARRRGDAATIGAYEMVQVAIAALSGWAPAVAAGEVEITSAEQLQADAFEKLGRIVYALVAEVPLQFPQGVDPDTLSPFVTFDAAWDIPPHGDVPAPPPVPQAYRNASDLVVLPQAEPDDGRAVAPVDVALMGDSYVAGGGGGVLQRFDYRGPVHWANHMLGGALRIRRTHQLGYSGETISQVATRVGLLSTLQPKPRFLGLLSLGHNDATGLTPIATSRAGAEQILDACAELGIRPFAGHVLAKATFSAQQLAARDALDQMWRDLAAEGRCDFIDWSALTTDPATGLPLPGVLFDGTHPGARGAFLMGQAIRDWFATRVRGEAEIARPGDPGLAWNALNAGSLALSGLGWSGVAAGGLLPYRNTVGETAGTKLASKAPRAAGGEWQRLTIAGVRDGLKVYRTGLAHRFTPAEAGLAAGDIIEGVIEVELEPGAQNLGGIYAGLVEFNGSGGPLRFEWQSGAAADAGFQPVWSQPWRFVIRTPPVLLRPFGAGAWIEVHFGFQGDGTAPEGVSADARFVATARRIAAAGTAFAVP
jgi:phage gp37-like protein/lysophospholipase L1-like esterase